MNIWYEIAIALIVIFLIFLIRKFLSNVIFKGAKRIFPNSFLSKIHVLEGPLQRHFSYMVVFLSTMLIMHIFTLPRDIRATFLVCSRLIFCLLSVLIISDVLDVVFRVFIEKLSTTDRAMSGLLRFYERVSKSCLWVIFFIAAVGICGFSISGLLTTIGVGGAALALASKDSLANFFGSVSLISDRVFKVGDTIRFGNDIEGVVEDIGLRSTRIRTSSKSLIVVPNSTLANTGIDNLSYVRGRFVSQKLFFENTMNDFEKAGNFIDELLVALSTYERISSPTVPSFDFSREGLQVVVTYIIPQKNCAHYFAIRSEVNKIIFENVQRAGLSLSKVDYRFIAGQTV